MQGNQGHVKVTPKPNAPVPTRDKMNRNWTYRGDNTKGKYKK